MNVSFDFDGTIDQEPVKRLAEKFIKAGHNVWITTSRQAKGGFKTSPNFDVDKIAKELGIEKNIKYTNYEMKYLHLDGFDLHFDNDESEVDFINSYPISCVAFAYKQSPNKILR